MDMSRGRKKLESEIRELTKQLRKVGPFIGETVSVVERKCGKPACACHRGGPKHPAMFVTWKEEGKTATLYVPRRLEGEVREWAANHRTLKDLIRRITELRKDIIRLRED